MGEWVSRSGCGCATTLARYVCGQQNNCLCVCMWVGGCMSGGVGLGVDMHCTHSRVCTHAYSSIEGIPA